LNPEVLRHKIIETLQSQGFKINPHVRPSSHTKEAYRQLQETSRTEQLAFHKEFLQRKTTIIRNHLISGIDLEPNRIDLELREVSPDSLEETIFRWWNLIWWSVPYQRAYGRQMRFVIWDKGHDAPFGLIGLQSPILKMSIRDKYLRIPNDELDYWINKSMQAQRLGALPPYNILLGGKMTAMAMVSNELREAYKRKYNDRITSLRGRRIESDLLFITTTSAFGRSSIYNRLKYDGQPIAKSLGYTKGSGSFHIPEALYREILEYLKECGINVGTTFGNGPSRKIKLLHTAFRLLKMPDYSYHNLKREFFFFPLVSNIDEIIQRGSVPNYYNRTLDELVAYWKGRWCFPRSERNMEWVEFNANDFINTQLANNNLN
jgi:hypothetical protein